MSQQRFLQALAADEQGSHSTVLLYGSPSGDLCIFKAANVEKPAHVKSLRSEHAFLTDLGQLSPATQQQQQQQQQPDAQAVFTPLLESHPHIIRAIGYRSNFVFENKRHEVLLLEYCANGSLLSNMLKNPSIFSPFTSDTNPLLASESSTQTSPSPSPQSAMPLSMKTNTCMMNHIPLVRTIFKEIVSGVAYIHSRGKYHGDLKLANILLDKQYQVKLADFGNAAAASTNTTYSSPRNHKMPYKNPRQPHQAPECYLHAGGKTRFDGQKADVFSLGVLAFSLIFNEYPQIKMAAESMQADHSRMYSDITTFAASVKQKIHAIEKNNSKEDVADMLELIQSMLSVDPSMRPTIFQVEESMFLASPQHISVLDAIAYSKQKAEEMQIEQEEEEENRVMRECSQELVNSAIEHEHEHEEHELIMQSSLSPNEAMKPDNDDDQSHEHAQELEPQDH